MDTIFKNIEQVRKELGVIEVEYLEEGSPDDALVKIGDTIEFKAQPPETLD